MVAGRLRGCRVQPRIGDANRPGAATKPLLLYLLSQEAVVTNHRAHPGAAGTFLGTNDAALAFNPHRRGKSYFGRQCNHKINLRADG